MPVIQAAIRQAVTASNVRVREGKTLTTGQTYRVKVVVDGSHIELYLDGELQMEYDQPAPPAKVFQVVFDCPCGCEHPGLVSDVELDWAPLGHSSERFLNLMTDRFESTEEELADLAVRRILAGQWPWSFYCYPERRPRPVFPSSFFLLAPGDGSLGP